MLYQKLVRLGMELGNWKYRKQLPIGIIGKESLSEPYNKIYYKLCQVLIENGKFRDSYRDTKQSMG